MKKFTLLTVLMLVASLTFAQKAKVTGKQHLVLPKLSAPMKVQKAGKGMRVASLAELRTNQVAQHQATGKRAAAKKAESDFPIITEAPAGETKIYQRSGGAYYASGNSTYSSTQAGTVTIVFAGNEVYIKDPVSHYTAGSWVKGTLSSDGTKITVPLFQNLRYSSNYDAGLQIAVGVEDAEGYLVVNENVTQVTYTIDGNTITLDDNTDDNLFGVFWSDDSSWSGYGDFNTVYTYVPDYVAPELVTPPSGLTGEDYAVSGVFKNYSSTQGWVDYTSQMPETVKVIIDGSDIYIQDLAYWFAEVWIKGTISGTKATFPVATFIGSDAYGDEYLVGYDATNTMTEIVFNYDEANKTLTSTTNIGESASDTQLQLYTYWEPGLVLRQGEPLPDEVVTPPAGLTTVNLPLSGKDGSDNDVTGTAKVGVDGTDVYVQGMIADLPEAWVKGTRNGSTVSFPVQYLGELDGSKAYLAGYSSSGLVGYEMVYDAERNTYEGMGYLLVNPNATSFDYNALLNYYTGVYLGVRPEPLTPPSGLEVKEMPVEGSVYDGQSETALEGTVLVAFDGSDVYIQHLISEVEGGWVKGTLTEDKTQLIIPAGQYVGVDSYSGGSVYVVGDNQETESIDDIVFTYNEEDNYFVLENNLYSNGLKDDFYYYSVVLAGTIIGEVADATWVAAKQDYADQQEVSEITIDEGVTGAISQGEGKNPAKYFNNGLALRLYAGNTLTITSEETPIVKIVFTMTGSDKQMLLQSDKGDYALAGNIGTWTGQEQKITFSVPNVGGNQARIQKIDIFYLDYSKVAVEAPADLVTEAYYFKGTDTYYEEEVTREVQVGFYGDNEVYIQGLSDFVGDAWVKGTLKGGVLTIPGWYLGVYYSYYGAAELVFGGATFTYDAEADKFTSAEGFTTTDGSMYWDEYADVTITKIIEKAVMPAQPEITAVNLTASYPNMKMAIPAEDVNGDPLLSSKLSYQLFIDVEKTVSDFVFTPELYEGISEEMTVVPYNFTDNYDINKHGTTIYLNAPADVTGTWNKIGVKSIYTGGGDTNETEIFWYTIKPYEDDTDGITSVEANQADATIYNVQGVRVNEAQRGLVIMQTRDAQGKMRTVKVVRK